MKIMKMLAFVAAIFCCSLLNAQTNNFTVKGKVVNDSTGKPLQSASISVSGTKRGTTTDIDGKFTIKVPDDGKSHKLIVSYLGFTSKEITVVGDATVTVKLNEKANDDAGEIIIQTGYGGGIKKKELAASVSTVGAKDLKDIPVNSVAEALNGRLAGVTATTAEGSPDAEVKIRVRGGGSITQDNSPLYVIDGVIVENGLNNVVLQDIQDISVLKDAAATAIYGARGANGVIVITTKSGKSGKLRVSYNSYYGYKYLPKTLGVMNPDDFIMYMYERSRTSATEISTFSSTYVSTWDSVQNFSKYKNVQPINWQQDVLGQRGHTMQHNIGVSGGSKKVTYNFGYTFQDDKAIVLNSSYKRHQLNAKTNFKITSKLKLDLSARYTNQNVYGAGTSDDRGTSFNRLRQTVKYRPYILPGEKVDEVDPADDPVGNGLSLVNPIKLSNQEYKRKTTNAYNITAALTYNINKRLSFKSTFGIDNSLLEVRAYNDSVTPLANIQNGRNPMLSYDSLRKKSWVNSNVLTYSIKNWKGKHDLDILLGQETRELKSYYTGAQYKNLNKGSNKDSLFNNLNNLGAPSIGYSPSVLSQGYSPGHYDETNVSFFTRIGYTYNKKYIFNFVVRADGSSKFAEGSKWGYFPSASAAWRVSNEKFFEKVKFFDDVKFRAGFGSNGNSRIGDYLFVPIFASNPYIYGLSGVPVNAWTSTGLVNKQIKWESTVNRNIGLDLVFLKKRLELSVDYYYNTSKDLLLNAKIAPTFGYTDQIQNIGKTKSSGFEIQLNAFIMQKKNGLNWNANFNMSFNKNEIVELNNGLDHYFPDPSWGVSGQPADYIVKVGQPVGAVWGFVTDGFYKVEDFDFNPTTQAYTLKTGVVNNKTAGTPQPGTIKFKDLDNSGDVTNTDGDKQIIGNTNPKFTGGINQQFSYKNFDASIFINFSYGNDIYNANKIEFTNGYTPNSNLLSIMNNRWRTVNDQGIVVTDPTELTNLNANATLWKPIRDAGAFFPHSWAIEDGSFIRLNNLTIGYSLPLKTLVKLGISKFRLYLTGNNLAILSSYSGFDPEVSVRKSQLTSGLDYSAYPKSRSFIFGINVNF